MQKPSGWDEAQAATGGQAPKPNAGGYVLGVVKIDETPSKAGEEMLTLFLDIARGPFKNHYRELGDKLGKDCYLRYYQMTQTEKGVPFFKGMITSFEKSNPGFDWQWDAKALVKRLVGANLRDEEYVNSKGEHRLGLKIAHLCSIETVDSGTLPILEPKMLNGSFDGQTNANRQSTPPQDDLPF